MTYTRRDALALAGGATLAAALPRGLAAAPEPAMERLVARTASTQFAPEGYPATEIWGYDGLIPGRTLRQPQGSRLRLRFENELPGASSVHWHGIRVDNAMDGVAGVTQPAVAPGDSFDYDVRLPDAGTFWYHAHTRSVEQVARGLYGALVVDEAEGPDVDRDEVLILDDWLIDPETAQIDADFASPHDRTHAGRRGNFITVNGAADFALPAKRHERLRLRLVNAANARIFEVALAGLAGWTMALDGMPLETPEAMTGSLLLGPGQRADLIVDVIAGDGETADLAMVDRQGAVSLVPLPVSGTAASERRPAPAPLPPNPGATRADLGQARPLELNMGGGAMGRLDAAILDGHRRSFRELVDANQFWAFNGVVGMTDDPLATLSLGESARLSIYNDTSFPHAMHLHGMHFREVLEGGGLGPSRDTLLMGGGERREIAFLADNPGKWLFHCHMLSHAAAGMMTWVEVA
ncbi:multicopper oxidase family protein (plasmid) [Roseivivax marinus]|uniref:multicopper oxidase family protein n=1 Tax=Roseivivax marinus TaxID=1379903 RepID=UPI001F038203|nr:multicopper oxidase family protein [Roseivivax marinus]UMA66905.1 multicopper oxidase family protein [Roseivivax marinus]